MKHQYHRYIYIYIYLLKSKSNTLSIEQQIQKLAFAIHQVAQPEDIPRLVALQSVASIYAKTGDPWRWIRRLAKDLNILPLLAIL